MFLFDTILVNAVYIIFPLSLYLIYSAYIKNLDLDEKKIYFEIALFSSLYLQIRGAMFNDRIYPMALVNIPLLLAYVKKSNVLAFFSSIVLVLFYTQYMKFNLLFTCLEFIIYFSVFIFFRKKNLKQSTYINIFSIIKAFFLSIELYFVKYQNYNLLSNTLYLVFIMVSFVAISYLVLYFYNKGEQIISLNNTLKDLEKEKKLRSTLSKINHEIKNPLAVCKGYLDMMDYTNVKKSKEYVKIIDKEIDRTLEIINDYSDYTKISIEKEEVDLMLLIEEIVLSLKGLFRNKRVQVNVEKIDDDIYVDVDYNRMKQVLINILKNSVEAKDKTRKLIINIGLILHDDTVTIKIKDNGIGMSKEIQKNMGNVFYTTKISGTGFGVCLSREIVELHGGSLKYNSKEGCGTTAYIKLPYKKY